MRLMLLLSMFWNTPIYAGSSFEYVGSARIVSVEKKSKSVPAVGLRIEKFLASFGSARPENDDPSELHVGERYYARIKLKKNQTIAADNLIFFHCDWACTKNGCSEKKWTQLSEEEPRAKANVQ